MDRKDDDVVDANVSDYDTGVRKKEITTHRLEGEDIPVQSHGGSVRLVSSREEGMGCIFQKSNIDQNCQSNPM